MRIFLLLSLLVAPFAYGQDATVVPEIIEIRKSLPMEPTEKSVRDFILNRGAAAGLKAGAYVSVVRNVTVTDPVRNKALGSLNIPVGRLQIIHVENNLSVARLHSELGNDERPVVEYEALMIGDLIDLNSISMDAPKASKKKWASHFTESAVAVAEANVVALSVVAPQGVEPLPPQPAQKAIAPLVEATAQLPQPPPAVVASAAVPASALLMAPSASTQTQEPAFILTPIPDTETPVKEKTSFIPVESATVSTAATAN